MKTHSFKANGLHLLFAFTADAPVKLLNFSFAKGAKPDPESKLTKWSRLVEIQANARDWHDHHGNKYTGTNPAGKLHHPAPVHRRRLEQMQDVAVFFRLLRERDSRR